MKKIIILVFIVGIYISFNKLIVHGKENIDLNLRKNEISITFVEDNILVTNKKNTLILLNENISSISRFGKVNIININNVNNNFDYEHEYKLNKRIIIDDIEYKIIDNLIKIEYNNNTFCIYNNQNISIKNTMTCNFLYLFNTKNIDNIETNENMDIIFFNEKYEMPTYFLEDIYSKWIDIYRLKDNEFISLIISEDDYRVIVIPNK